VVVGGIRALEIAQAFVVPRGFRLWFFRAGFVELNLWFGVLCVCVGVGVPG
jgi:hypothetical protein